MKKLLVLMAFCLLFSCVNSMAQNPKPDEKQVTIAADKVKAAIEVYELRVENARLQLEKLQREASDARLALLEAHGLSKAELTLWDFQIAPDGGWVLNRKPDTKK